VLTPRCAATHRLAAASTAPLSSSLLLNRPPMREPRPTMQAPVRVATSTTWLAPQCFCSGGGRGLVRLACCWVLGAWSSRLQRALGK